MRDCLRLVLIGAVLAAAPALMATPAAASRPVPKQITGCVIDGFFITHDGYRLRPRFSGASRPYDVRRFEGRRLTLDGALLPGDAYILKGEPRDTGPCPDTIRRAAERALRWAWRDRARDLREAGDFAAALGAIDRALTLDPTLCLYEDRAVVREALGRIDDAIADLTHASTQADCREIDRNAAKEMLERLRRRPR